MINKDSNLCMDKICRSCMTESTEMRSVYDASEESIQFSDMIMACTTVQILPEDGLPNLICLKCEEQLNIAYLFKKRCEKTDVALREYCNSQLPTFDKEESLDIVIKPDIDILDIYDCDPQSESESKLSCNSLVVTDNKKSKTSNSDVNRQCRFCDKVLTTKEGLKLHERRHTGEKLKSCPVCSATFAKTNHLVRHMGIHNRPTDEYVYTCQECGLSFTKVFQLMKHKREHKNEKKVQRNTVETYKLNDTTDIVINSSPVETKKKIETPPKVTKYSMQEFYTCEVCKKIFTTISGLHIHMRRHTGENLSTCHICQKTFTKSSHLTRHMQTHGPNAQKQYITNRKLMKQKPREKTILACEFCDRNFVYRKSFLHHLRSEHKVLENESSSLRKYMKVVNTEDKIESENIDQLEGNIEIKIEEEEYDIKENDMEDDLNISRIKKEMENEKGSEMEYEEDEVEYEDDDDVNDDEDSEKSTDKTKDYNEKFKSKKIKTLKNMDQSEEIDGNESEDNEEAEYNKVTIKGILSGNMEVKIKAESSESN